jgi:hypothetical protein
MGKRETRHPATAVAFDWDEANVPKLAERRIRPQDVEAVHQSGPTYRRNKRAATAVWLMEGTDGGGRRLQVGILWADESNRVLRAITARVLR